MLLRLPNSIPEESGPLLVRPLTSESHLDVGVLVAWSFGSRRRSLESTQDSIPVRVLNLTDEAITVPALSPLAELETGAEVPIAGSTGSTKDPETIKKMLEGVILDPHDQLTPQQLDSARAMLVKYADAFAPDPKVPGTTHAIEVELELKEGAKPHRHAPPRLGYEARTWVREHCLALEKANIIKKIQLAVGLSDCAGQKEGQ